MGSEGADPTMYDVLIIGGGPAGLAAATAAVRQQHTGVIFDSGRYRNAATRHMHNVPTWDHRDPADFRAAARRDAVAARYSTFAYEATEIASAHKVVVDDASVPGGYYFELREAAGIITPGDGSGAGDGSGRRVAVAERTWRGRKLVLALGVENDFPPLPGYAECWGRGVFHCLFCHGYEERHHASAGVLAVGVVAAPTHALHVARNAAQLVPAVTVYTDGDERLAATLRAALAAGNDGGSNNSSSSNTAKTFTVDARKIASIALANPLAGADDADASDVVVTFADGSSVTEGFLSHSPRTHARGSIADQLGCEMTAAGDVKVTPPFQQTSVPGVFAAGDCQTPMKAVAMAMASGSMAAAGATAQLQAERYGHKAIF